MSEFLPKVDEQKRGAEGIRETAAVHESVHANISHDDYTSGKEKVKQVLDSQTINTHAQMTPVVNLNYNGKGQLPNLPEQQGETLRASLLMISKTESSRSAIKDLKNTESRRNAEVISKGDTLSEELKTGIFDRAVRNDVPKGFGGHGALPAQTGATAVQNASLKSISSGPFSLSSPAEGRSSMLPSSKIQMNQSNTNSTTHVQPETNLPSKDFVSSFSSTPHMNKPQGNVESSPQSRSPQVPSREKFVLESSSNLAATTTSSRLPSSKGLGSGPYLSKQFLSVILYCCHTFILI